MRGTSEFCQVEVVDLYIKFLIILSETIWALTGARLL